MRTLLTDNHEPKSAQRKHIHRAIAIYRSLLDAGVIERLDEPDARGRTVRLTVTCSRTLHSTRRCHLRLAAFD